MTNLQKRIKNARVFSGAFSDIKPYKSNTPSQVTGELTQYYGDVTKAFRSGILKYASNFFEASVQGLVPGDFLQWTTENLRMADIIRPSGSSTQQMDDSKIVVFENPNIDFLPRGTKIVTSGSTWLVTNPDNIGGVGGNAVIKRCNATWRFLDYYGNVVEEPIVVDSNIARASSPDPQNAVLVTKGYFNVKCQLNPYTSQFNTNTRLLLGSGGYQITGFTDFIQEFTGDDDSIHMLEFTIRYEEPNPQIDDLERKIAGGKTFSWDIAVIGKNSMKSGGDTAQFVAESERCGESVSSTETNPISYIWSSTDERVATVASNGLVTTVGEGTCYIVATLAQNPDISTMFEVVVAGELENEQVGFLETPPASLNAYESAGLSAAHFLDGEQTSEVVQWEFTGADKTAYSAIVDGNNVFLSCWGGSVEPLVVTASYNGVEATATINLLGV